MQLRGSRRRRGEVVLAFARVDRSAVAREQVGDAGVLELPGCGRAAQQQLATCLRCSMGAGDAGALELPGCGRAAQQLACSRSTRWLRQGVGSL